MASIPVQIKRSSVAGKVPLSGDLLVGELAVNFPDKKLYTRNGDDEIITVGGGISDSEFKSMFDSEITTYDSELWSKIDSEIKVLRNADSDYKLTVDSDIKNVKITTLADVDKTTPLKNLSNLFYDSDSEIWVPLTLRHREDSFVIDSDTAGTNSFTLTNTPNQVTNFFRNGMRIVKAAWSQSDSDAVYYSAAQNGNSPVAIGDEIQITYNTISE